MEKIRTIVTARYLQKVFVRVDVVDSSYITCLRAMAIRFGILCSLCVSEVQVREVEECECPAGTGKQLTRVFGLLIKEESSDGVLSEGVVIGNLRTEDYLLLLSVSFIHITILKEVSCIYE